MRCIIGNFLTVLVAKYYSDLIMKEREHYRDLIVDGRVTLELILQE
jgi:hypothetical protein